MSLNRIELSLLRLSDGIATDADKRRLSDHYTEDYLHQWSSISSHLQDVFTSDDEVDIVERVFQTLITEELIKPTASIKDILLLPNSEVDILEDVFHNLGIELKEHNFEDPESISIEGIRDALLDPEPIDLSANIDNIMGKVNVDTPPAINLIEEFFAEQSIESDEVFEDVSIPNVEVISRQDRINQNTETESLVEFTEVLHFPNTLEEVNSSYLEEDSDEICTVDESAQITEDILHQQDVELTQLSSLILHSLSDLNAEEVDIWSSIIDDLKEPPLRLIRDEDVDGFEVDQESFETTSTNVEFLNSKSIDADSTISKISITVLGSFMAIAAAWLIIVLPSQVIRTSGQVNTPIRSIVTFEVAEVNELQVENLEVGANVNVQILQGELNAPTIIFIDQLEEE